MISTIYILGFFEMETHNVGMAGFELEIFLLQHLNA